MDAGNRSGFFATVSSLFAPRAVSGPRPRAVALARALLLAAVLCLGVPGSAAAKEWTSASKFSRGVSNLTLGVLAWPGEMVEESKERGPAIGVPLGFVTGLGWFAAREVVGVYEFLTCVFEAPPGFRPILRPEYPWQYFENL